MKTYWPHLTAIAALWLLAMQLDWMDLQRQEMEELSSWKESYEGIVIACLNRGSFWFPDTGEAFECEAKSLGRVAK